MKRTLFILTLILTSFFFQTQESEAQIFNTKLRITVLDDLGNIIPEAEVTLYANQDDYNNEVNPIQETMMTDDKGRVTFRKLELTTFYVIVRKGDVTNAGGGEVIRDIEENKLNKVNVVISDEI